MAIEVVAQAVTDGGRNAGHPAEGQTTAERRGWVSLGVVKIRVRATNNAASSSALSDDLDSLIGDGVIGTEFKQIGSGGDGVVYIAHSGPAARGAGEFVAIKIPFMPIGAGYERSVDQEWAALNKAWDMGIAVPKPVAKSGRIMVMGFIGYSDQPAPGLKGAILPDPAATFATLAESVIRLREAGVHHGDVRPDNVLVKDGKPFIIDFSRAELRDTPFLAPNLRSNDLIFHMFFQREGVDTAEVLGSLLRRKSAGKDGSEGAGEA